MNKWFNWNKPHKLSINNKWFMSQVLNIDAWKKKLTLKNTKKNQIVTYSIINFFFGDPHFFFWWSSFFLGGSSSSWLLFSASTRDCIIFFNHLIIPNTSSLQEESNAVDLSRSKAPMHRPKPLCQPSTCLHLVSGWRRSKRQVVLPPYIKNDASFFPITNPTTIHQNDMLFLSIIKKTSRFPSHVVRLQPLKRQVVLIQCACLLASFVVPASARVPYVWFKLWLADLLPPWV